MIPLFADPAVLSWCLVMLFGIVGEFTGFRGAGIFIASPALATAICAASFSSLSVAEQTVIFALLFSSHVLIVRHLSAHDHDDVDPRSWPLQ